jgi:glycosyltransferase involved in cell wall biosynthesis
MHLVPVCHTNASGGAERYLNLLYPRLRALGHDVQLVGSVPGWDDTGLPSTPVSLGPKWGRRTLLTGLPRLPRERRAIEQLVNGMPVDVFHAQFKREQIGLTDLLRRHAPVIWTEHGRFPVGGMGRALAAGYRRAARNVAAIICVSELVAENVRAIVGPEARIEVVLNAIDTVAVQVTTAEERRAARAVLGLPGPEVKVLAWVGRASPGKLPLLAVETGRRFSGVTVIAGDGQLAAELRARADGDRVRYLGFQSDPSRVYRAADALLFTSDGSGEGMPYTLLEAAAHGLPIVANSGSGLVGLVEAAGGRVVADDPAALAAAAEAASTDASDRPRAWALANDLDLWARRHADIMRSVTG